jgi:hypothetical protein
MGGKIGELLSFFVETDSPNPGEGRRHGHEERRAWRPGRKASIPL